MKRLGIIQYGGSYEELAADIDDSSMATYFGQQDALRNVDRTGALHGHCTLVSVRSPRPYSVDMSPSSRVVGLGLDPHSQTAEASSAIAALGFTHVLLQTPIPALLAGLAAEPGLRLAAAFADSFNEETLRARRYRRQLIAALNHPSVEFVANHGPNAARHLVDLGVTGKPVLPYDYEYPFSPADEPVKSTASAFGHRVMFVGTVCHEKGVSDLLEAMQHVRAAVPGATLSIVGDGTDRAEFEEAVAGNGLAGAVEFTGVIAHDVMLGQLRDAAVAVVPSRHCYGEGLPLTIYEAWATRTPLVTSDHPMFRQRAIDGYTALVVPERNPSALGGAIARLLDDDRLYARLSDNAVLGWQLLQGSVGFWPMVWDWLSGHLGADA